MEKQSKISLNLILAGLFGWQLLANGCGKPAGSDKVSTKGTALGDKAGGEPCEDCVSPGSRSALLLAAAKNQQSNADPANIADPIIEKAIRRELKKPTGELTKADLEKVTKLDLSFQQLTDVPKGLEKLTQLTELFLNHNKLIDVPKELEKLTQLKRLYLSGNQLTSVKGLEKLTQLTGLNLSRNRLTDVKGLEKLTQLTGLALRDNKLTDVTGLEKLTQLTGLNLENNQLTDVKGLENLAKLEVLWLANNPDLTKTQITELKKAFPIREIYSNPTK